MSADKYPSIFSRQMKAIVYLVLFTLSGISPHDFPVKIKSIIEKLNPLMTCLFLELLCKQRTCFLTKKIKRSF